VVSGGQSKPVTANLPVAVLITKIQLSELVSHFTAICEVIRAKVV
jgi:hypothetical protein